MKQIKNRKMVRLGRKGGKSDSVAKTEAARINGAKGGRPRKTPLFVARDLTAEEVKKVEANES